MSNQVSTDDFGNALLSNLAKLLEEKEPGWTLARAMYPDETQIYGEWKSDGGKAIIQIAVMSSPEEAATHFQMFDWYLPISQEQVLQMAQGNSSAQLPQPLVPDGKIPGLGDESSIWVRVDEEGRSVIKLRKGKLYIQIEGSSAEVARGFAEHVSKGMPAI